MTVSELIKLLADLPGDAVVVMDSDAEGNDTSPLAGVTFGTYVAERAYSGEFHGEEQNEDGDYAVCLYPVPHH